MVPTSRLWRCPNAEHKGVLAPGQMRKDDVRRFCWPCSEERGRLVERTCVVREAKAQTRKERERQRKDEAAAKRAAERDLHERGKSWQRARRTRLKGLVRRAMMLGAWKRLGGKVASTAVRRANWTLVLEDGSPPPVQTNPNVRPRAALYVGLAESDAKVGLYVLARMAAWAKNHADPSRQGQIGEDCELLLHAAACELWPEIKCHERRILATWRLHERESGTTQAIMTKVIEQVLHEVVNQMTRDTTTTAEE